MSRPSHAVVLSTTAQTAGDAKAGCLCAECYNIFARQNINQILKSPSGLIFTRDFTIHIVRRQKSKFHRFLRLQNAPSLVTGLLPSMDHYRYRIDFASQDQTCYLCYWLIDQTYILAGVVSQVIKVASRFGVLKVNIRLRGDVSTEEPISMSASCFLDRLIPWHRCELNLISHSGTYILGIASLFYKFCEKGLLLTNISRGQR